MDGRTHKGDEEFSKRMLSLLSLSFLIRLFQKSETIMAWAKLVVLFSLVLGLPLLGLAQFGVDSLALKFQRHHIDPTLPHSRAYCNLKMEEQDVTQGCKPLNTLVHEPLEKVQAVCLQENVICKDGQTNCYWSKSKRPPVKSIHVPQLQVPDLSERQIHRCGLPGEPICACPL